MKIIQQICLIHNFQNKKYNKIIPVNSVLLFTGFLCLYRLEIIIILKNSPSDLTFFRVFHLRHKLLHFAHNVV